MAQTRFDFGRTLLIGVGVQKAGTTWLTSQLALHPGVHAPKKELHYWDRIRSPYREWHDLRGNLHNPSAHRPWFTRIRKPTIQSLFRPDPFDHSGYLSFFRHGYDGQDVLHEFSPGYVALEQGVFDEMSAIHDDVRFIILLRDPVSRLWSGVKYFYRRHLRAGMSDTSLYRAFENVLDDPKDRNHLFSDYARLLSMPVANSANVHIDFFETMFTQDSYDRVLAFAGLGPQDIPRPERINVKKRSSMPLPEALADKAAGVLRPSYDAVRARFGSAVPSKWRA